MFWFSWRNRSLFLFNILFSVVLLFITHFFFAENFIELCILVSLNVVERLLLSLWTGICEILRPTKTSFPNLLPITPYSTSHLSTILAKEGLNPSQSFPQMSSPTPPPPPPSLFHTIILFFSLDVLMSILLKSVELHQQLTPNMQRHNESPDFKIYVSSPRPHPHPPTSAHWMDDGRSS